jgi:hypothetical protein
MRGVALVAMIINHTSSMFPALIHGVKTYVYEAFGFFSMAEVFFFIAGVSAARAYVLNPSYAYGGARRVRKVFRRVALIYAAHVATLAWVVLLNPAVRAPLATLLVGIQLGYQPILLDILPLYLGIMMLVPILAYSVETGRARFAIGASVLWYALAHVLPPLPDSARFQGVHVASGFDLGGWQILFVIAFVATARRAELARIVRPTRALYGVAAVVALALLVLRHALPEAMIDHAPLLFGKRSLGLVRLVDFLVVCVAWQGLIPRLERARIPGALVALGRNSLVVFTLHVFVAYGAMFILVRDLSLAAPSAATQLVACTSLVLVQLLLPTLLARVRDASSRGNAALFAGAWLVPLAFVPGWGNGYTEPKIALTFALGAACLFALAKRAVAGATPIPVRARPWALAMGAIVVVEAASLGRGPNTGLALETLGLTLTAVGVVMWLAWSATPELDIRAFAYAAVFPLVVVLGGALAMIVLRHPVFSFYSPFGATVGLKNSLSVLLASSVPFLLVLTDRARAGDGRDGASPWSRRAAVLAVVALLAVMCWVVFANRTRSAWWMFLVYAIAMAVAWVRSRERAWGKMLARFVLAAGAGAILLVAVPNRLRWTSSSPYVDSLATLASFEASSGRDKLWRVALHMLGTHPLLGTGPGNYAVTWRATIPETNVDPAVFAFLRPDLSLFNDYLQMGVECGVVAAGLLAFAVLIVPTRAFWRLACAPPGAPAKVPEALAALACVGIAFDAFFDYPFNRPETLLVFAVCCGLACRALEELPHAGDAVAAPPGAPPPWWSIVRERLLPALAVCSALLVGGVGVSLSVGLTARRLAEAQPALLARALAWWPWDPQWNAYYAHVLLAHGQAEVAERYAILRRRAWPEDPESFLIEALVRDHRGEESAALEAFRRAIVKVPGGRCHLDGFREYTAWRARPELPAELALTPEEQAPCKEPRDPVSRR